jgi:hypothetical protein
MSFLLLPPDELALVSYMCGDLDLALLLSDLTDRGVPRIATEPLAAVPDHLPSSPSDPRTFIFWCHWLGPVRTLADASESVDPADRVAGLLTREAAGDRYGDVVDLQRTPVIRWHRTSFQSERRLKPGLLQVMPLYVRDTPSDVLKLHRQVDRWMKKHGERLNPFDHCRDLPIPQPRNLNPFWVWVHRHAMDWVSGGGEIWPWTA